MRTEDLVAEDGQESMGVRSTSVSRWCGVDCSACSIGCVPSHLAYNSGEMLTFLLLFPYLVDISVCADPRCGLRSTPKKRMDSVSIVQDARRLGVSVEVGT